jgi:hypothetical protein
MITVKHPRKDSIKFSDLVIGETFIVAEPGLYDNTVYAKTSIGSGINGFNYGTGLSSKFDLDEKVILVDVIVEYSIRT